MRLHAHCVTVVVCLIPSVVCAVARYHPSLWLRIMSIFLSLSHFLLDYSCPSELAASLYASSFNFFFQHIYVSVFMRRQRIGSCEETKDQAVLGHKLHVSLIYSLHLWNACASIVIRFNFWTLSDLTELSLLLQILLKQLIFYVAYRFSSLARGFTYLS